MTEATRSSPSGYRATSEASASRALLVRARDVRLGGWLFVLPALAAYGLFVLWPIVQTFKYSLYRWDGVAPAEWVGLDNFKSVFTDHDLVSALEHAFQLIIYFTGIPVVLGLIVASVMRRVASRRISSAGRVVLFLPQVVPLVAAGIAWSWMLASDGVINQALSAIGLGGVTRAWLGDFGTALPAVGVIGAWVLLGLCTVLLLRGNEQDRSHALRGGADRWGRSGSRVLLDHPAEPPPGDRRLRNRHRHRRVVGVRHRLHLDPRRPGRGRRWCPA